MNDLRALPKLRDSLSFVYLEHARIERKDGALAAFDVNGETHLPVAALGVLLLGPGTAITQEAVRTAVDSGCSLIWTGENGVRVYAQGLGETRIAVRLLRQAHLHARADARMAVVLKMYEKRFGEKLANDLSIEQIRGKEGVRVRSAYASAGRETGVSWEGRNYDRGDWYAADPVNRALSAAAACLYGICHCAIISAGYSTALGFIHTGKLLSFVYDVADLYRVELTIPVAFEAAAAHGRDGQLDIERQTRLRCRDIFKKHDLLDRVVRDIDDLMSVESKDVERAHAYVDGPDDPPGWIWDPSAVPLDGGVNHGPD